MNILSKICAYIFLLTIITGYKDYPYFNDIVLVTESDTLIAIGLENSGPVFPKYVFNFNSVPILNIIKCSYKEVPDEITTFVNLEKLNIRNCYEFDYGQLFFKLRKNFDLTSLNLQSDSLKVIPSEIKYLKELKYINLNKNQLKEIPKELFSLEKLEDAFLEGNNIRKLDIDSNIYSNLERLDLSSNNLTEIPEGLEKLKTLRTLHLEDNENLSLEDICSLVKELNLNGIWIRNIKKNKNIPLPKNIINLKKVGSIVISARQFTDEELQYFDKEDIHVVHFDKE
jgi:Leucine-rich repeat (LRR) protein